MSENTHTTILRRMAGQQKTDDEDPPLTSSRAVRLALTKSANDSVGLVLTVLAVAEAAFELDALLADLNETLMLIRLERHGALVGLIAVDVQFRAAVLEMQTIGQLIGAPAEERAATSTDKIMCDTMLNLFLKSLPTALVGTDFEGWVDDIELGGQISSTRAAGLILTDQEYLTLRMSVDLGVADREGAILIALPPKSDPVIEALAEPEEVDWHSQFGENIFGATVDLDAVLHRFDLPLGVAQNLRIDQVLPLRGCSVHSVKLMSMSGQQVALAKLGQIGGYRAIRLEAPPDQEMQELASAGSGLAPSVVGAPDMLPVSDIAADIGIDVAEPVAAMPELPGDVLVEPEAAIDQEIETDEGLPAFDAAIEPMSLNSDEIAD